MIIWIASYPRSGNTLLRLVLGQIFGHGCYESEPMDARVARALPAFHERIGAENNSLHASDFIAWANSVAEPVFIKTHLVPEDGNPVIFVVRDGRAAIDSYLEFHRKLLVTPDVSLQKLIVGDDYYGDWSTFYRRALEFPAGGALMLRFEDLVKCGDAVLQRISEFTGIPPVTRAWVNPLEQLHAEMPIFFRHGGVHWQEHWPSHYRGAFALLHGELMEELGYYAKDERNSLLNELNEGTQEYVLLAHELAKEKSRMSAMLAAKESTIHALKATCDERLNLIEQLNTAMQASQTDSFLAEVKGVIHIGASYGQERDLYAQYGLEVLWVEPIPEVFAQLVENLASSPLQQALECLVTDRDGAEYEFHISNNEGMSSSILDLKLHRDIWPEVHYDRSIRLISKTLPTALTDAHIGIASYDALVMDTQGSELLILQGAASVLEHFRYIKTEAPDFEAYEGCCLVEDLARFLAPYGFVERSRHKFAERAQGGSYFDVVFEKQR